MTLIIQILLILFLIPLTAIVWLAFIGLILKVRNS